MVTRPELIVQADPAELDTALDENDELHVTGIQSLQVAVEQLRAWAKHFDRTNSQHNKTHLRKQPIVFGQNTSI